MAYTQPAFMVAHPLNVLALSKITPAGANTFTDDSKRALVDSRQGELGSYTALGASAGVIFDAFGTLATMRANRCVVPAGHNFAGKALQLYSDDVDATFGSFILHFDADPGTGVIDISFALVTNRLAWVILQPLSVATDIKSFGEFWVGERVELTAGSVQPAFQQSYTRNVATDVIGGRDVALELTPPRKTFTLGIRYVEPGSADWDILEEVLRLGRTAPFWYWPPDSTDPGPYLVKLDAEGSRAQENVIPRSGIYYSVRLSMIEQTS